LAGAALSATLRLLFPDPPTMLRVLASLLGLVVGYLVAALAGDWAIATFSGNMHDRSLEAITTAVFVIGPAGAIVGAVAGFVLSRARKV
jgi:hypothetical protein